MENQDVDLRQILSQNIKAKRKSLGITQAKLAELAEISEPYMNDIERCQTWISDKTLSKLSKALLVKPYELFIEETECKSDEITSRLELLRIIEENKQKLINFTDDIFDQSFRTLIEKANTMPLVAMDLNSTMLV